MKKMNVLSLFNGMGCIWLALDKLGISVEKRYSSEIDKYATIVNDANYPDTIQIGDIRNVHAKDLDKIDLIVGGSPCHGFSFAGKQLAFDDPRSKLFFEFVRLVNECKELNPDVSFLLENVKMKHEHEIVISKYMGVAPIEINSALLSAQNRVRLYWTNIANKPYGLFGDMYCNIPQPKDRGILLKDILQPENEVDEKYYLKDGHLKWLNSDGGKRCVKMKMASIDAEKANPILRLSNEKWNCNYVTPGGNRSDMDLIYMQKDSLVQIGNIYNNEHNSIAGRVYTDSGKSVTISSQGGCGGAKTGLYATTSRIRRLTPIECERLQTVPDNYTNHVSDSQRYKMLGNGWTVDVIAHILSFMK